MIVSDAVAADQLPVATLLNRDSVLWRYFGDWRLGLVLGRGLVMQVCHPTIGAGVADHSVFESDPWGRLRTSLFPIVDTIYAADGAETGRRIRAAHKDIGGANAQGQRYHAYEPEAYWFVLATAIDSVMVMAGHFCDEPISPSDNSRLLAEMREVGLRMGLRERDMPATWSDFTQSYDELIEHRLENHPTAHRVLDVIAAAPPPARLPLKPLLGRAFTPPVSRVMTLATVGTLPPTLRCRLGLEWTRADERELRAVGKAVRMAFKPLPGHARYMPVARKGWAEAGLS